MNCVHAGSVSVSAQNRCKKTLDAKDCNLSKCRQKCLEKYNGNGECHFITSSSTYECNCFYNC